jgi:hypothetical protein
VTFSARVQGGTGAGKKRSLLAPHPEWECDCRRPSIQAKVPGGLASRDRRPVVRPGWLKNCKDCGARRPT